MTIQDLLARTEAELASLAATGLGNAGPALRNLNTLAEELTAAGLGKLGDRLRSLGEARDDRTQTAAWSAAWTGVDLVRTRLLKPQALTIDDAVALPHAPNTLFPHPQGDLASLEGLLAVLQSADPFARAYAAGRLVSLGDEAVARLLAIQKQCGRCIRFQIVETLAHIGTDKALSGLAGLLGDGDVARPLEAALLSLGERCEFPVAEALAKAAVKDKKRRRAAAKLLWRLSAARHLQAHLNDADELVKAYAQATCWSGNRLAVRSEQSSVTGLPAAVVLSERGLMSPAALVERLDALSKNHLADAARVVWHTDAEQSLLAHYLPKVMEGGHKKERERAAAVITHLANPVALEVLLRLLEKNAGLAFDALGQLADSAATWPLIDMARRSFPYQRDPIISALGNIGDPAATPALLEMLKEAPARAYRESFEKTLIAIGAPAAAIVGEALLHLETPHMAMAPVLERVLMQINMPDAQAALQTYQAGTDELTRLLRHLADGQVASQTMDQVAGLGADALEPLLNMVTGGGLEGQRNAIQALIKIAPRLTQEECQRVVAVFRDQLRAQQRSRYNIYTHVGALHGWISDPLVEYLTAGLCTLDASAATPEIRDALIFAGVGKAILHRWKQKRPPWILDVVVQGIQTPATCYQALQVAREIPLDQVPGQQLWAAVETTARTETDAHILQAAIGCLRAWDDPRAVPLLRAVKQRWGSVTGQGWVINRLSKQLDDTLTQLGKKQSLLGRLLGR